MKVFRSALIKIQTNSSHALPNEIVC